MKCSKCGYVSFDHFDNCKKCGFELLEMKGKLNIPSYFIKTDTPIEPQEKYEVFESIGSFTESTQEDPGKLSSQEEELVIDPEQTSFREQEDTFQFELEGEDEGPELTIEEEPDETTDEEQKAEQIKTGISDASIGDDISLELEDDEVMEETFLSDQTTEGTPSTPIDVEKTDEIVSLEESPIEELTIESEQFHPETQEGTISFESVEKDTPLELDTEEEQEKIHLEEETSKAIMDDLSDDSLTDDLSSMLEDGETLETEILDEDIQLSTSEIESLKQEIALLEGEGEDDVSIESSDIDILEFEEESESDEKKSSGESEG
ncbi:MAG: hypothetical protein SWO11_03465 [Thermodesulfobacteriota bacterium]|nr:hypothetical protein [Thermodesulfobacteriota bacterium]